MQQTREDDSPIATIPSVTLYLEWVLGFLLWFSIRHQRLIFTNFFYCFSTSCLKLLCKVYLFSFMQKKRGHLSLADHSLLLYYRSSSFNNFFRSYLTRVIRHRSRETLKSVRPHKTSNFKRRWKFQFSWYQTFYNICRFSRSNFLYEKENSFM